MPVQLTQPVATSTSVSVETNGTGTGPTAVRDEVDLHKARLRLRPVGEGLDGDLVLQQRARSHRAQPTLRRTVA
jgi:hypothetical protein